MLVRIRSTRLIKLKSGASSTLGQLVERIGVRNYPHAPRSTAAHAALLLALATLFLSTTVKKLAIDIELDVDAYVNMI